MKRYLLPACILLLIFVLFLFSSYPKPNQFHACVTSDSENSLSEPISSFPGSLRFIPITLTNLGEIVEIDTWQTNSDMFYTAFNRDGSLFAAGDGGHVHLLSVLDKNEIIIETDSGMFISKATFNPDGTLFILTGFSDGLQRLGDTFFLTNVESNIDLVSLTLTARENINQIKFSPNSKCVAFGSSHRIIRLWDVERQTEIGNIVARNAVTTIAFSPNGRLLAYGTDGDNDSAGDVVIGIWDLEENKEIQLLRGHNSMVSSLTFNSDGSVLASSSFDHTIRLWDVQSGTELATFSGHTDRVSSLAFSADDQILASGGVDRTVNIWDVEAHRELITLEHPSRIVNLTLTPNMEFVISVDETGILHYWGISS